MRKRVQLIDVFMVWQVFTRSRHRYPVPPDKIAGAVRHAVGTPVVRHKWFFKSHMTTDCLVKRMAFGLAHGTPEQHESRKAQAEKWLGFTKLKNYH